MSEDKPFERQLVRTEVTPNGTVVEYWSNDHGGEDVVVHARQLIAQGAVRDFVEDKE